MKELHCGYMMTREQREEVDRLLLEDIVNRYNHPEYHDYDIVEEFAIDNDLKQGE